MLLEPIYKNVLRPGLFQLDAEDAHDLIHKLAPALAPLAQLFSSELVFADDRLTTEVAGRRLLNPVGLAAGFDKNGNLVNFLSALGFGFAEIGSVTAHPSSGNPKPRLFRLLKDEAIINRMGLNGDGAAAVTARLQQETPAIPYAVNIAKTNRADIVGEKASEDLVASFRQVKDLPSLYVAINVSCPNTHEGVKHELDETQKLLERIVELNTGNRPLFIKLSPDSPQEFVQKVVGISAKLNFSGFICGNTTTSRKNLHTDSAQVSSIGAGGLSGRPLRQLALNLVKEVYRQKSVNQQIIACGGISSGREVYEFIRAGANAVQIYTAMIYHGPTVPFRINEELAELLKADGLTVQTAVGSQTTKQSCVEDTTKNT